MADVKSISSITKFMPEASSDTSLLSSQKDRESRRVELDSLSNLGECSHGGLASLPNRGECSHDGLASLSDKGKSSHGRLATLLDKGESSHSGLAPLSDKGEISHGGLTPLSSNHGGGGSSSSAINLQQLKRNKHKKKIHIKTLEKRLKLLNSHIKKCSEAELSLDEMKSGSSVYMREDLYKRKFIATWQELCNILHICDRIELTEQEGSAMYSGSRYPEINRRVQRLLELDEFPDHFDILELVGRCNSKYDLGISAEEKSQLSRQIFNEIGKLMKARRQQDYHSHFGCHLTDYGKAEDDPALLDDTLLQRLLVSVDEGKVKMEQVCEEFVTKQEQEYDSSKSTEANSCYTDEDVEEEACQEIKTIDTEDELDEENPELEVTRDSCEPENELTITTDQDDIESIQNDTHESTFTSKHDQTENIEVKGNKQATSDLDEDFHEDDDFLPPPKKARIESTTPTEVTLASTTADSPSKTLPTSPLETRASPVILTKHEVIYLSDSDSDCDIIFVSSQ